MVLKCTSHLDALVQLIAFSINKIQLDVLGYFNLIIHLDRKDCNYLKIKKNASVTLYEYGSVGEQ